MTIRRTTPKQKGYIEKTDQDAPTPFILLVEGLQNVYYIIASFIFGMQFAITKNILYLFLLLIPIIIKFNYDKNKRRIVVRVFR